MPVKESIWAKFVQVPVVPCCSSTSSNFSSSLLSEASAFIESLLWWSLQHINLLRPIRSLKPFYRTQKGEEMMRLLTFPSSKKLPWNWHWSWRRLKSCRMNWQSWVISKWNPKCKNPCFAWTVIHACNTWQFVGYPQNRETHCTSGAYWVPQKTRQWLLPLQPYWFLSCPFFPAC